MLAFARSVLLAACKTLASFSEIRILHQHAVAATPPKKQKKNEPHLQRRKGGEKKPRRRPRT